MDRPYDLVNASLAIFDSISYIDNALEDSVFSAEDIKTLRTVQRELFDLSNVVEQIRNDNFEATLG